MDAGVVVGRPWASVVVTSGTGCAICVFTIVTVDGGASHGHDHSEGRRSAGASVGNMITTVASPPTEFGGLPGIVIGCWMFMFGTLVVIVTVFVGGEPGAKTLRG